MTTPVLNQPMSMPRHPNGYTSAIIHHNREAPRAPHKHHYYNKGTPDPVSQLTTIASTIMIAEYLRATISSPAIDIFHDR